MPIQERMGIRNNALQSYAFSHYRPNNKRKIYLLTRNLTHHGFVWCEKTVSGITPTRLKDCMLKATKQIRIKPNVVLEHYRRRQIAGELVQ